MYKIQLWLFNITSWLSSFTKSVVRYISKSEHRTVTILAAALLSGYSMYLTNSSAGIGWFVLVALIVN